MQPPDLRMGAGVEEGARAGELRCNRAWVKSGSGHFCQSEHIGGAICEAAIGYVEGAWQHIDGRSAARCERPPSAAPEGCKLKRSSQHADRGWACLLCGGSWGRGARL